MKYTYIKITFSIAILLFLASSCTKKFDEWNTNPNMVTEDIVKVNGLMTQVMANSVAGTFGGKISEFVNFTNPGDGGFPFFNSDNADRFDGFYRNYLINANEVVRLTKDNAKLSNKNAIARIYKVWLWQTLTDRFGDIPFTEAALGVKDVIIQPAYDTQESIYKQLFEELKNATELLDSDGDKETFGTADIIYGGDVEAWKRFANSLRLRMAMRVRYVDQALAQSNIDDVLNAPLITTNEQTAKLISEAGASVSQGYYNPFRYAVDVSYTNALRTGFTPVELLITKSDPRLPVYFNISTLGAGWRGAPVNIAGEENPRYTTDSLSLVGDFFRAQQYEYIILSAAEVSFLKAEAALFGLSGDNADALYKEGIQKAMEMYSVNPSEIGNYLATPAGSLTGTDEEKLRQIIEQKYVALIFQSDEVWAEYRRTGYPLLWIGSGTTSTNGIVPRRLTYPLNEYLVNESNVTAAASRIQGGDVLTAKVWWDTKPGLPYQHPRQGSFPPETW